VYRLAILSDVHADVHALTDALATIGRMGCDAIVCAGDVLDYGLFPDETIAQRLWPEYVAAARHAIDLIYAPETSHEERGEAVRRIEEIILADEERERVVLAGVP